MKQVRTESIIEDIEIIEGMTCDVCGKSVQAETIGEYASPDVFEAQEFHTIDFRGGYGSVFGDGTRVTIDICQHCLKQMIGKYAQYNITDDDSWCYEDLGQSEKVMFMRDSG